MLSSAIGCAISLLPEPQSSLLWKPVLRRADHALELLTTTMIVPYQSVQLAVESAAAENRRLSTLGGPCFSPEIFCFCFSSLRAAREVARAGRPSLQLFETMRATQAKTSAFLTAYTELLRMNIASDSKSSTVQILPYSQGLSSMKSQGDSGASKVVGALNTSRNHAYSSITLHPKLHHEILSLASEDE